MASISSLTSSSSSSIYGSRSSNIISGLASGLDTESLIQGMVQDIQLQIDEQEKKKTTLGWEQEAYQSISDQLVSLSNKYTSYTSSTNLMSDALFESNIVTALGNNASKIEVSGSTESELEILGVKNLATSTKVVFNDLTDKDGSYINTSTTLEQILGSDAFDSEGKISSKITINGVEIGGNYTKDTTMSQIISDINNSDAGVKVTYSQTANQFVFTSTTSGAGGEVEISSDGLGSIFTDGTKTEGQDATMAVKVNGKIVEVTSNTNTFNIDGLVVSVNQTFNEDGFVEDGSQDIVFDESKMSGDSITFNQKADADKIVDTITAFVEEYNAMLADLREAYTTKPDSEYTALTDDQKAEMTEEQIEKWEEKAKQGILFGDSDLRNLATELRFAFSSQQLQEIGITTSTDASEGGKLYIDEEKLRAAIQSDPDSVKEAFNPSVEEDSIIGGGMAKFKEVLDKYASTTGATKGILIEKAGSEYSSTSLLQNSIQKQLDDIDEMIEELTDKLNDKIDFYTSKFSKLEVLISQANSQSSYLSGMSGGY